MKRAQDRSVADLLRESEEMIRRMTEWAAPVPLAFDAEAADEQLANLQDEAEPVLDASVDVFLDDDLMAVSADFHPPGAGGKPLERESLELLLAQRGVTTGLLHANIDDALARCNLDHELVTNVLVAAGEPAVASVPAHFALEAAWTATPKPDPEALAVDWKALSPFVMVQKGDLLAHRVPEVEGHAGTTVQGTPLVATARPPQALVAGENVVETPVGLEAASEGRLLVEKGVVAVRPVLELDQGIGYRTGHIRFHGDVIVHKQVADGFLIEAGGALTLDCVLDAWKVKTGADLTTNSGIVGKPGSRLEVGGAVRAKYLNNVTLSADGDVLVENSVLNSLVKTRGRLVLGDKGIVAGGSLHTLGGVDTGHISTPTGPRTELICGLDFRGMDHILALRESSRDFSNQLRKVEAAIPHVTAAQQHKLEALAQKIREDLDLLMERAREQLANLGQDEDAKVTVRGTVWPDTVIEICHVRFLVTQKLSGVQFALDKRKGVIAVTPLKKG